MNEKEIVELLKVNEKAAMFLPDEVQDFMEKHKTETIFLDGTGKWNPFGNHAIYKTNTYRLPSDYNTKPELLEIEIEKSKGINDAKKHRIIRIQRGCWYSELIYTDAIAEAPPVGYEFLGFKYEHKKDGSNIQPIPVIILYNDYNKAENAIFPTHVVYRKVEK